MTIPYDMSWHPTTIHRSKIIFQVDHRSDQPPLERATAELIQLGGAGMLFYVNLEEL
jgi:hypothetical protein